MEESIIREWLRADNRSGSGSGSGSGDGYGSGDGDGYGYGYGDGVKTLNNRPVYYVDDVPTFIDAVKGDYAVGQIIDLGDFTTTPTYIAKVHGYFAHGETLKDAVAAAESKWMEDRPLDERIDAFIQAHPREDVPYGDLFVWHHTLTGSCEQGRREWCRQHGLHPDDEITVRQFITLTASAYGGDAIRELAKHYNIKLTTK